MTPPRAVITGTGRSGSGYIAQVLREAGVPCGHEEWWNPQHVHTDGLLIDSSWCALAIGLDRYKGHVFHQVRHPLDVVSSFMHEEPDSTYRPLRLQTMPTDPDDPVEFGMLAWYCYVELAEHRAQRTWRLEDVNPGLIVDIAAAVGVDLSIDKAQDAIDAVPGDYNWHGGSRRLSWPELPAGWLRDQLLRWAAHWGWE